MKRKGEENIPDIPAFIIVHLEEEDTVDFLNVISSVQRSRPRVLSEQKVEVKYQRTWYPGAIVAGGGKFHIFKKW